MLVKKKKKKKKAELKTNNLEPVGKPVSRVVSSTTVITLPGSVADTTDLPCVTAASANPALIRPKCMFSVV